MKPNTEHVTRALMHLFEILMERARAGDEQAANDILEADKRATQEEA